MTNVIPQARLKNLLRSVLWGLPIAGDLRWKRYLQENYRVEMDLIVWCSPQ